VLNFLKATVDDAAADQRPKVVTIYALLFVFNIVVWAWAFIALAGRPTLLGTAALAYVLGLRHAVDADHIAAIDNVVRKLMQEGKRPVAVGLFFSLGHSLVVILAVVAIAATAFALQDRFEHFKSIGSVIGTGVSAFFLLAIAAINLVILRGVWRSFQRARRGEPVAEHELEEVARQLIVLRIGICRIDRNRACLEPRDEHGKAERVQTGIEQHQIVAQRRQGLAVLARDLPHLVHYG